MLRDVVEDREAGLWAGQGRRARANCSRHVARNFSGQKVLQLYGEELLTRVILC